MPLRIEDYALIGDGHTAALVGNDGSIDWLCLPRFDSAACFAALLGTEAHGRWRIAPASPVRAVRRRYRPGTLVLETEFDTAEGTVALVDCMPLRNGAADLVRVVEGRRGRVPMAMELVLRFDYGSLVPWVHRTSDGTLLAVCGPDQVALRTPAPIHGEDCRTLGEFTVGAGETVPFHLVWTPSHLKPGAPVDAQEAIAATEHHWRDWLAGARVAEETLAPEMLRRSLLTLKALTYAPTGGICAAPTTSLPETLGGERNWDYRLCWLRDAALTLNALVGAGHLAEAESWRRWLVRAVAGTASQVQPLYGLSGERRVPEMELSWLPGYEGAKPVRIGNDAGTQRQLDVYGEVIDAFHAAEHSGLKPDKQAAAVTRGMLQHLAEVWREPDEGIWEVRGPRRQFVHSKVMVWVAFDRAVKAAEHGTLDGPVEAWRAQRDAVHAEICARGFDARRGCFVQSYGATAMDASLLRMALVGFLPADDPRFQGTVRAIEEDLLEDGLVLRYRPDAAVEGLAPTREGTFLACTAWLGEVYALQGRRAEAEAVLQRLLGIANDVGLLAEEYDHIARRQVGNFPQAFSHLGLVGLCMALARQPAR
ncbi:glycoside hydrolase family 15 protein [Paracraurococcus ruber]|uniref:Glucoamylase n=1 Tax=Paracraurococcus ruber TaxID=77675 RepID=A0ABS1CZL3_9PROT|nr:glycoside hydrolase family 15 protein [Paracraurococcus ruber]MBK1659889.1 glucoamylase [Paracraurococcus ruber]TDG31430.1 glycoside hydrolase family 15 protein [Paracraurococcus ruber]